jgi:hypothetical protein
MAAMNRIFGERAVALAIAVVSIAGGCTTTGASRLIEVRVATRVETGSPRLVVTGPAQLLHVDVHGHRPLNLYSVRRGTDGKVSCLDGARGPVRTLHEQASNELNIAVAAGEALCVTDGGAGASTARDTDVSWHARSSIDAPVETVHASIL